MQRTIHAPEKEWLTLEEAAVWLGIPAAALRRWESGKLIPRRRVYSGKTKLWSWEVVAALNALMKAGHLQDDSEEEPPE